MTTSSGKTTLGTTPRFSKSISGSGMGSLVLATTPEYATLQSEYQVLQQKLNQAQTENQKLQQDLQQKYSRIAQLNQQLSSNQNQNQQLGLAAVILLAIAVVMGVYAWRKPGKPPQSRVAQQEQTAR